MRRRRFLKTIGAAGTAIFPGQLLPSVQSKSPLQIKDIKNTPEHFWNHIKKQFLFPDGYTYLNTGGIGAVPKLVLKEVQRHLTGDQKSPRAGHNEDEWEEIKKRCSSLLGPCCSHEELAFTANATEGINIVINGLPLKEGDEVITSRHEHPALHIPLLNRMQYDGIKIKVFEPDPKEGLNNVNRIKALIGSKTKLIFISHVTCTVGQRMPVKEIGELAKNNNIWFGLDGAQAVGALPTDLSGIPVDFYAFSGHKWTLGPKRTGVLYIKRGLWDIVRPLTVGAYSDGGYDIDKRKLRFVGTAGRYEFGTQNPSLFAGLLRAINFLDEIGRSTVYQHNRELAEDFYNRISTLKQFNILSPLEVKYRSPMVTIKPVKGSGAELARRLYSDYRIRVRHVLEAGLDGVRISFHICNGKDDVEKLMSALQTLVKA